MVKRGWEEDRGEGHAESMVDGCRHPTGEEKYILELRLTKVIAYFKVAGREDVRCS